MNALELTGRASTHVTELGAPRCVLHTLAAPAFLEMRAQAAAAGIDLAPVSAFRDFDRQLYIWNEKFHGRRALYNRAGQPLDPAALTPPEIVQAILYWSALPGASRHHWGSEIDVIDRAALPPGASAQLLPVEYSPGGPFARLTAWLDRHMGRFGFFRPYRTDRGGVAPEPWHLSFAPVSRVAITELTEDVLREALQGSALAGKALVLGQLPEIYRRYVADIDPF